MAHHGGVKVTYKDRLSDEATATEAEWLPIEKILRRTSLGGQQVEANVTTADGVVFVPYPPNLLEEPKREAWCEEKTESTGIKAIEAILRNRKGELSPHAMREWRCLLELHRKVTSAVRMPDMPHTVWITGDESTKSYLPVGETYKREYSGAPMKLLPILEFLAEGRFRRPLISWKPFEEAPPSTFPAEPTVDGLLGDDDEPARDDPDGGLRDPRLANGVSHNLQPRNATAKGKHSAKAEEWAEAQLARVEEVVAGKLYLAQLEDNEGEFFLGLCRASKGPDCVSRAFWYRRCSLNWHWGYTFVSFQQYDVTAGTWHHDELEPESVLLEVRVEDLTPGGQLNSMEKPALSKDFMERVRAFVDWHHHPADNLLKAPDESGPADEDWSAPEPDRVPKARATASSRRLNGAVAAAAPGRALSMEAAANREAAAAAAATKADAAAAASTLKSTKAVLKVKHAAKAAAHASMLAGIEAANAAWGAQNPGDTAQGGNTATGDASVAARVGADPAPKRQKKQGTGARTGGKRRGSPAGNAPDPAPCPKVTKLNPPVGAGPWDAEDTAQWRDRVGALKLRPRRKQLSKGQTVSSATTPRTGPSGASGSRPRRSMTTGEGPVTQSATS